MSWEKAVDGGDHTFPAADDLSSYQYHAVQIATDGQVDIADATVRCCGILQNNDADAENEPARVRMLGVSKAVSDGSSTPIVIMDALAPDASGHLVKTTSDDDEKVAYALEASTASGKIIAVFVLPFTRY